VRSSEFGSYGFSSGSPLKDFELSMFITAFYG
jgi:hypothetical protein